MAVRFIYLEKAYATIPREMTMGTLGWMGVPEAEVKVVERIRRARSCVDRECQESPK